ncbi:SacI domain-containing protein [Microthyrium microscopicum]|uniref:SacI domain-containing protein n=1 Tax=Microthyrium microscopicum TaxID=703497 RepID=A0A6A6UP32_9PEZI|nr:SacI domain-containing protein [Microthyrium microscopicum]
MPGIVRKLLIFAAVDGLILQPAPPKSHRPATEQAIKITYKGANISPLLHDRRDEDTSGETLEAHGIVGLLNVASLSFLVSISRREQVALISGKPIYSISEVALIPLSSQADAEQAIAKARSAQFRHSTSNEDFLSDSENSEDNISLPDDASVITADPDPDKDQIEQAKQKVSNVAENVINKKGIYGRFADKWFSKQGWTADSRTRQGMSSEEDIQRVRNPTPDRAQLSEDERPETPKTDLEETQEVPTEVAHTVDTKQTQQIPLLPKVLATTKIFFGSKNFFYSYDYDISHGVTNQTAGSSVPLHRTFDSQFFWNKHLIQPFLDVGQDAFTTPLIQGFVGQREFTIDPSKPQTQAIEDATAKQDEIEMTVKDSSSPSEQEQDSTDSRTFLLTLVSRRSVDRAGLRYLRRGADEDGHVANSVETEQILCSPSWDGANTPNEKLYSYLQYRGSMPLFFSQSPYSLKPIPVFRGTPEQNLEAFKVHFSELSQRYGRIQVVNLVEKKGNEGKVGELYERLAEKSGEFSDEPQSKLAFYWFDFHHACKGMKFENVSYLFDTLKDNLSSFGWTSQTGAQATEKQNGVLRTNCMDCLDRTNVVQSAAGRGVLEAQLAEEGLKIDLQNDPSTSWFNTLWADNGDAISKQYAGTAALKGDFTRTRKRNVSGALTDFGLTLNRYYNNIVNDYFTQAVIDFLLGRADENIFIDFEADMKGQDYAIDLRKVRQNAIETCTTICVEEQGGAAGEHLIAGWALRCPRISGTIKSHPFEECVLLLTNRALYFCRMDWATEKVQAFEKVELEAITGLTRGTFITDTFASRDLDEKKNVGFLVNYSTKGKDMVRINTRSLTSNEDDSTGAAVMNKGQTDNGAEKVLAFKALPPRSSYVTSKGVDENPPSEEESTRSICDQIAREVNHVRAEEAGEEDADKVTNVKIEEQEIVSIAEAKKSTSYLDALGYSLKKLVWAT